jgi:hypothetical protein
VLLLVNLGSVGCFISSVVVQQLGLQTKRILAVTVTVADGGRSRVDQAVPNLTWECQGHTFSTTFRVFDVPSYDMILGMDWLESLSPM